MMLEIMPVKGHKLGYKTYLHILYVVPKADHSSNRPSEGKFCSRETAEIILHTSTGHMVHLASAVATGWTGVALVVWLYWSASGGLALLVWLWWSGSTGLPLVVWLYWSGSGGLAELVCLYGLAPLIWLHWSGSNGVAVAHLLAHLFSGSLFV
ncbi:unnamed protein product [Arctogadus glacialis]